MPDDPQHPSHEVLAALVVSLRDELANAYALLDQATTRVAELEARLATNSRNSSKPPSSDGLAKPAPKTRSLRRGTPRKPGGQPGHEGRALRQVTKPDRTVVHEPRRCGCGRSLAGQPVTAVERRQCFDLPPIRIKVTEHQLVERQCPCGTRTRAQAPAGIDAPVQYGPRVTAIIVYLYVGQFLSKQRTAQALGELFGTPVSTGTVATAAARAAGGLEEFLALVGGRLAEADVVGFDETGLRVEGKLHWVHCARTDKYTLVVCDPKRGREGMDTLGVLDRFRGVAVHDAWAPYDTYLTPAHQLCCAHALRELQAVADAAPTGGWCWATQAAEALVGMQRLVAEAVEAGRDQVDPAALAKRVHAYHSAAVLGMAETQARSSKLMRKHHALARRLVDRQDDYLRFTRDFRVPPDNNGSERDIRMVKLRQKVSGCMRTLTGARQFCAVRSYLSTAAKHGMHFFEALVMLAQGRPWMPDAA